MTLSKLLHSKGQDDKGLPLIVQCCACKRFEDVEGEFFTPAEAMRLMYENNLYYTISHTYCPDCYEDHKKEMRK